MAVGSAASVISEIHYAVIRRLAGASGNHIQGINSGISCNQVLRKYPKLVRKLRNIEISYNLLRHIILFSSQDLLDELDGALRDGFKLSKGDGYEHFQQGDDDYLNSKRREDDDDYLHPKRHGDDYQHSKQQGGDHLHLERGGDDYQHSKQQGGDHLHSKRSGDDYLHSKQQGGDHLHLKRDGDDYQYSKQQGGDYQHSEGSDDYVHSKQQGVDYQHSEGSDDYQHSKQQGGGYQHAKGGGDSQHPKQQGGAHQRSEKSDDYFRDLGTAVQAEKGRIKGLVCSLVNDAVRDYFQNVPSKSENSSVVANSEICPPRSLGSNYEKESETMLKRRVRISDDEVPLVDMGAYISNTILEEDGVDDESCSSDGELSISSLLW